ncbi:hypothetical protein ACFWY9_20595 [Amycolatopsis sp. NPDC059027]|uniref:hypothetical protein n=1 Tax=unclassified Amycolatopsis TaxID=2618356 RepID=UPI003672BA96
MTRLARGLTAVVLLGALAACSGDRTPGRDEIIAKIKADPQTRGTSDQTAGCLADWYLRYATPAETKAFVDGTAGGKAPDSHGEQARAAMLDCLKTAADTR